MKPISQVRNEILSEPPSDDLIQDLLPDSCSAYMLICGRSAIGKTFLLLDILYCLAVGMPFLSHKTKPCKVGYLSFEGDKRKILARMDTIKLSYPNAEDNLYWEHTMGFVLGSHGIDRLEEIITGLDVVGIDPLRPLVPGDYTSPKDVSLFLKNLSQAQNDTGTTMILTHHIRKPDKRLMVQPEDLLFEVKGASEFVEGATTVLLLERIRHSKDKTGKFITNFNDRHLHFVKVKDAPVDPIPLTLRFDGEAMRFLPITDDEEEQ